MKEESIYTKKRQPKVKTSLIQDITFDNDNYFICIGDMPDGKQEPLCLLDHIEKTLRICVYTENPEVQEKRVHLIIPNKVLTFNILFHPVKITFLDALAMIAQVRHRLKGTEYEVKGIILDDEQLVPV